MKIRKALLALVLALFLLLCASCGQTQPESTVLDYGAESGNHYSAAHQLLPKHSELQDAVFVGQKAFYYTFDTLYCADVETGEEQTVDAFSKEIEAREKKNEIMHQIYAISPGIDDTILVAAHFSIGVASDPNYDPYARILILNTNGTLNQDIQISDLELWTPSLAQDEKGYTYLVNSTTLYIFDTKGKLALEQDVTRSSELSLLPDGSMALLSPDRDNNVWIAQRINEKSGKLTKLGTITPPANEWYAITGFYPGTNGYDLFYTSDLSLYGCALTEDETRCDWLLSWINCGVEGTGLQTLRADEGKDFTCFSWSSSMGAECVKLHWQETDPNAEKITLTLACRQLSTTLTQAVLKFNQQSVDCRIEVKDYGVAGADGVDRLTTDLNAGNAPDLFCIDGMDWNTLIRRGYLEDLWSYIDNDTQLSREDLVLPVFEALSVNGSLYTVMDNFCLETALALPSVVGDEPGWTLDEFWDIYESMDDCQSIAGWGAVGAREYMVDSIVNLYSQLYVDWDEGTATFDSPEFVQLLELAALLPEERLERTDESACWLLEGRQMYAPVTLCSVDDYFATAYRYLTNPNGKYKGLPGLPGSGAAFYLENQLAMFSGGEYKEQVWEFLRMVLLPENQDYYSMWSDSYVYWMPTNREVYDRMIADSVSRFSSLQNPKVSSLNGAMIPVSGWTMEDTEPFRKLIEDTHLVDQPNTLIGDILRDEMNRFFAGQQDAQTAAKAIQNRVQLCLDEQS